METGAAQPATILAAPAATACASSSSPSTRTGAKSARAATTPSPRAAAVPPTAPGASRDSPPVNTALTFPACTVNRCVPDTATEPPELARSPARRAQSDTIRCQRAADPISGRAREPSGSSTRTAGAAVLAQRPLLAAGGEATHARLEGKEANRRANHRGRGDLLDREARDGRGELLHVEDDQVSVLADQVGPGLRRGAVLGAALEAAAVADHGGGDGLLRRPIVGERELAEVAHHDHLLLFLDHDVVEMAQVELVHVQPGGGGADDRLGHVRLARELGIALDEALDERLLGQLAVERAGDAGGELLGVEHRRLFGEPVHRPPEDVLQRGSGQLGRALGHRHSGVPQVPFLIDSTASSRISHWAALPIESNSPISQRTGMALKNLQRVTSFIFESYWMMEPLLRTFSPEFTTWSRQS